MILPEFFWRPLTLTATPQMTISKKCYQVSKPEIEFHMIDIIYAALPMGPQTEKATFLCKDVCTLMKHTRRWTYSALQYFLFTDSKRYSHWPHSIQWGDIPSKRNSRHLVDNEIFLSHWAKVRLLICNKFIVIYCKISLKVYYFCRLHKGRTKIIHDNVCKLCHKKQSKKI